MWGALVIAGVYMLRAIRDIWHGDKEWAGVADATEPLAQIALRLAAGRLDYLRLFSPVLTDNIKTSVAPVVRLVGAEVAERRADCERRAPMNLSMLCVGAGRHRPGAGIAGH